VASTHLHPVEKAHALESRLRLLFQDPGRILKKYIRPGMTVLDLGCGTGYFTLTIAGLLEKKGKVIATDVQQGMLEILKQKLQGSELRDMVQICNNPENSLGVKEKVDFIFAFYSFHEMRYIDDIILNLKEILKPGTKILISEQKFHVTKDSFNTIIQKMEKAGFEICERPRIFLSRTVIMKNENAGSCHQEATL
jgi:ubiquinone/menaquinone biosynthesis C-methylase UbiE